MKTLFIFIILTFSLIIFGQEQNEKDYSTIISGKFTSMHQKETDIYVIQENGDTIQTFHCEKKKFKLEPISSLENYKIAFVHGERTKSITLSNSTETKKEYYMKLYVDWNFPKK